MSSLPLQGEAADGTMTASNRDQDDIALEVKDIKKAFPGVVALDNVSISIRRGEVHGLVGKNGAGKSTLIKIISGIYAPNSARFVLMATHSTV